jgi:hypothetical protein
VLPKEYRVVRETADELNYARTDRGDRVYLSIQFSPAAGGQTRVVLVLKSLPS